MAAIPNYLGDAMDFDRSSRDTERMHDVQMQRMLQDLTQQATLFQQQQQQRRDQQQQLGQEALRYGDQSTQLSPAPAPSDNSFPQPPAPALGAGANTAPYIPTPPVAAQPMPLVPPGQSSSPLQSSGGGGAPPNLASLPQHSMQFLAQQAPNQRAAALQALLANVQNPNRVNMARGPAAGSAPAAPMQGPAPAPAPASGPAPTPNAATGGWQPSPGAGPALGGKPPQAAGAPASNALGAPPIGMGGIGGGSGMESRKIINPVQEIAKMVKDQHMTPDQAGRVGQAMLPVWEAQNKSVVDDFAKQSKIAADVMRYQDMLLRENRLSKPKEAAPLPIQRLLSLVHDPNTSPEDKAVYQDQIKRLNAPTSSMIAGAPGATGLSSGAVDLAASQYLATGQMPPLGFSSQALRTAILNRAAELQQQTGETTEEVPGKRAEFKANQTALTQITKDLTAIAPFQEMLSKNSDILKTLAGNVVKTDNQLANRSINWLQNNMLGKPNVAEYLAQVQIVQTEAARVLNNPRLVGQLTDSARHEMQNIVSGNMSLGQTVAVVDRLQSDANNRVNAMRKQSEQLRKSLGVSDPLGGMTSGKSATPQAFATEAQAAKAGLKPGTRVTIGGVSGTWQ